jgi:predicted nuclease of predicted toxin-antitoxin system
MKLLLDQNLSFKLVPALSGPFPGSKHLRDFDLTREDDEPIWSFAAEHGFTIVSKDADFMHRALLRGHPPKFIHLRVGNCPTVRILELLLDRVEAIQAFLEDPVESLLTLS